MGGAKFINICITALYKISFFQLSKSGTIGIDTVSIIPFLVKSIKEQQETIEHLRAEIQFIKSELGI